MKMRPGILFLFVFLLESVLCRKDRPLRIAILSTYPPTDCGIAEFTKNMCNGIIAHDSSVEIEIFSTDKKPHKGMPSNIPSQIKVHQYVFGKVLEDITLSNIAKKVNSGNFDALLVQHELGLLHMYTNYEKFLNSVTERTKTFVFIHTGNPYVSFQLREAIQRLAVSSDYIVALGWKVKYFLTHSYGIPKHKVLYIPHGVQLAKIGKKIKKDPKKTTFLMAGLMREMKGVFEVLDAMDILKKRGTLGNAFLHISGKDYIKGRMRDDFMKKAAKLNLLKRVKWDFGFHPLEKMTKDHLEADVFLAPFKREVPTSGTISFALAAGMATIATPFGLSGELLGLPIKTPEYSADSIKSDRSGGFVKYTRYGAVIPFNDTVSLANAMERLIKDKRLCKEMGKKGKARMKHLKWANVSALLLNCIRTKKQGKELIPDMYKKHYLPTKAQWTEKGGIDLNNKKIEKIPDGAYTLYSDGYSIVNGLIKKNKIVDISVRVMQYKKGPRNCPGEEVFLFGSRRTHPKKYKTDRTIRLTKSIQVYSPSKKQNSIVKKGKKVLLRTPNIRATISLKKNGSIEFNILKVSRFALAKGLLGFGILKRFSGFHQSETRSPKDWIVEGWASNVFNGSMAREKNDQMKGQLYGLPYTTRRNIRGSCLSVAKKMHLPNTKTLLKTSKKGSQTRAELIKNWPNRRIHIKMPQIPTKRSLKKDSLESYILKHLVHEGLNYTVNEKQPVCVYN